MLDDRKSAILRAVVAQYIETAQPVGSSSVAARTDIGVSPATVRNDMTVLEREGYLVQPHTSAGRIPTEAGYRFFVDDLAGSDPSGAGHLSPVNVRRVREFFATAHGELEALLRETSHLLSTVTSSAAVVVAEQPEAVTVRSVQLVDLAARTVLAVAVLSTGDVAKRAVEVAESPDAEELAAAAGLLAGAVVGTPVTGLASFRPPAGAPGAGLAAAAAAALRDAVEAEGDHVYVDGASRLAGSFDGRETIAAVLELLEQQFVVVGLLKELVDGGLRVAIGSETGVEDLADCSLVVAPYRVGGDPAGAIAVLGPTRMNYAETVSAVAAVSQRLSRLLTEG